MHFTYAFFGFLVVMILRLTGMSKIFQEQKSCEVLRKMCLHFAITANGPEPRNIKCHVSMKFDIERTSIIKGPSAKIISVIRQKNCKASLSGWYMVLWIPISMFIAKLCKSLFRNTSIQIFILMEIHYSLKRRYFSNVLFPCGLNMTSSTYHLFKTSLLRVLLLPSIRTPPLLFSSTLASP